MRISCDDCGCHFESGETWVDGLNGDDLNNKERYILKAKALEETKLEKEPAFRS